MLDQKDFISRGYQVLAIDIKYLRAHPSHAFFKWWWKTQNTVSLISDSVYIYREKIKQSSLCSCGCVLCVSLSVEGNKIFHLRFRFIEAMINKSLLILKNHFAIQINILISQVLRQILWMYPSLWVVGAWEVLATWICTSWLIDSPNGHHPQHSSFHLPKTSEEHKSCCWLRDPTSTTTMDLCMQRKFLQLPQGWTKTCEFKHSNFYQTTWTTQ